MIDFLKQQNASQRKLRLFGCAHCRYFWHLLDAVCRSAVETSERYADGKATMEDFRAIAKLVQLQQRIFSDNPSYWAVAGVVAEGDPTGDGFWSVAWDFYHGASPAEMLALDAASEAEVLLLRDIFGNPFQPLQFDPTWCSDEVVSLGKEIYETLAFRKLPDLGIVLQESGCNNPDILSHCQSSGPHVRGCWVIDLILGFE